MQISTNNIELIDAFVANIVKQTKTMKTVTKTVAKTVEKQTKTVKTVHSI